jgi:hypothetical protein
MTPPGRAVSPLDSLAPDQRAALELVVRQRRSYGELADLLGIPEAAVRARAHGALEALAPDLPPPPDAGELADFLLGQQSDEAAGRTRERVAADAAAQRWVMTVGAPLGELAPEDVELPAPRPAARPREPRAADPPAPAHGGRSSRLGGAILIGAAVVVVAAALIFVLTRGGGHKPPATTAASPTPTATAATDQLQPNDVVMRGPAGSRAVGLMRLFTTSDKQVHFLLAGQNVPPNRGRERYALWFVKKGAAPLWLGNARFAVKRDGALAMSGPPQSELKRFPTWFASYDTVEVTRDGLQRRSRPGTVIIAGSLPTQGG